MKDFLYKKSWYTVIEIIVAIVISSFIILWLTGLLQKFNSEIFNIQSQTSTFSSLSNFQSDFNNYKFKYTKAINVVDNPSWYDVLLLMNTGSQRWIIVWVVDKTIGSPNYLKLDPVSNYNIFWDKILWIKELTTTQTQNALSNSGSVYSIVFNDSNLYSDVKVDSFIINAYNSWSVMDISMDILTKFYSSYIWKDRASVVDSDSKYRVNISLAKDVGISAWPYSCVWTLPSWTGAILSSFGTYSSWVTRSYLWTWVSSETWTLLACTRKCDAIWYEGNIWWIDSYTKLLLHWDWTNNSTTFTDSELTPKTVLVYGNTKISTAQTKFGGSSMYFDWTWDYLSIPASSDFDFGNGDVTIDFWMKLNTIPNGEYELYANDDGGSSFIWSGIGGNGTNITYLFFGYNNGTQYLNDYTHGAMFSSMVVNTWYHIALVRAGNKLRAYVDGQLVGSDNGDCSGAMSDLASNPIIGSRYGTQLFFNGYIDELRISKWIARRTSNFTPPVTSYDNWTINSCKIDSNTTLLLHWDWVNNSTTFTDSEPIPKIVSVYGNAKISTTQSKFWWASMYFDANSSTYASLASSSDWNFGTGNFTIDLQVNPSITHTDNDIIDFWPSITTDARIVLWTSNNFSYFINWDGDCTVADTSWTPIWQWTHYAIVRDWTDIYLFKNWNLSVKHSNCTRSISYSAPVIIWKRIDNWTFYNWYLDELRISKWIARWTTSFTPPSIAY